MQSNDWTYVGAVEAARTELDVFRYTIPMATWVTEDMNAMPGATQVCEFAEGGGLVATLIIQRVTFQFRQGSNSGDLDQRIASWRPQRICEGGVVKLQRLTDSV